MPDDDDLRQLVKECLASPPETRTEGPTKRVFLLGDSHALNIEPSLAAAVRGPPRPSAPFLRTYSWSASTTPPEDLAPPTGARLPPSCPLTTPLTPSLLTHGARRCTGMQS